LNLIIGESPLELRNRLYANFALISKRQLISSWKNALNACQSHLAQPGAKEYQDVLPDPKIVEED